MEEKQYLMKACTSWTYAFMFQDIDYWDDSLKGTKMTLHLVKEEEQARAKFKKKKLGISKICKQYPTQGKHSREATVVVGSTLSCKEKLVPDPGTSDNDVMVSDKYDELDSQQGDESSMGKETLKSAIDSRSNRTLKSKSTTEKETGINVSCKQYQTLNTNFNLKAHEIPSATSYELAIDEGMSTASNNAMTYKNEMSNSKRKQDLESKEQDKVPSTAARKIKEGGRKDFQCEVCDRTYTSAKSLKMHRNVHQGTFQCSLCSLNCWSNSRLKRHLAIHSKQRNYKCCSCEKTFKEARRLKRHEAIHADVKDHQCQYCSKGFTRIDALKVHVSKVHVILQNLQCDICGEKVETKHHLKVHKATHIDKKKYKCTICGKGFRLKSNMKIHEAIHSRVLVPERERNFKCDICSKKFFSYPNLWEHHKRCSSTWVKKVKCDHCPKMFVSGSHLRKHMVSHSNARPYVCEICEKSFKTERCLEGHSVLHTDTRGTIQCTDCDEKIRHQSMRKHMDRMHTEKEGLKCVVCDLICRTKHDLKEHTATHTEEKKYKCKCCEYATKKKDHLQNHMKSMHA